MKHFSSFFLLLVFALSANAGDAPRVGRTGIVAMEKSFDDRVTRRWDDNPDVLLGTTRGVYLDGYGAVFTTDINLVTPLGISPFHLKMSDQEIERYRAKKTERIPQLRILMRDAMVATATAKELDAVPAEEKIVIVAFLMRYSWENPVGIPVQIMMQASKGKLLDAKRTGANLDNVIHVTEY